MENKTFKDLMSDKTFVEKLINQPTMEEAKKLFENEGVSMTDEEMETLRLFMEKTIKGEELTEEELKKAVGAGTCAKVVGGLIGAGLGFVAGGCTGLSVGMVISENEVSTIHSSSVPSNVQTAACSKGIGKIGASTVVGATAGTIGGAIGGATFANWIVGDSGKKNRRK